MQTFSVVNLVIFYHIRHSIIAVVQLFFYTNCTCKFICFAGQWCQTTRQLEETWN